MATNQMRREAAKRKLANQQKHREERARRQKRVAVLSSAGAVVVVVVAVVLLVTAPWKSDTSAAPQPAAAPTDAAQNVPTENAPVPARPSPLPAAVDCAYPAGGQAAKPATPPAQTTGVSAQGTVAAALTTSAGPIGLTLDRALAPCTVNSFVSLAQQGYFDGTTCHRLTTAPGLQVLQCGDPSGSGSGGPGYSFADETFPQITYGRGLLAMANAGPNTNGSQFFMIYGNAQLDPNYTVFGTIDAPGLQTLDTVAAGGTTSGSGDGAPATPVTIETATVA
ncbi:peptidylprolyl isomerase [Pseudonocardia sp. WMMC193]|uniref:peptidylprolyl isomerase n=1 Tax=Pseudonocardia sp. WMMC193 TaxID=2911965 RepID=UPI001F3428A4|nr:peptidylprolyl isomerase [Pseudonocardia sp. WMMC193]MCF7549222.1 peptidylprolyl isomerase [Pseudonocardia sp. WMMC193]